jgi:choline kinase
MGALTEARPKCLVEVQGRTLLERQLAALRASGIKEIGIVTG